MENEEQDVIESQNDTDTTENEEELDLDLSLDDEEESGEADEQEDDKDKLIKSLQAQKAHWKKKASEKKDAPKEEKKTESNNSNELSLKDQLAIIKSDVDVDNDLDTVLKFARNEGLSVSEALKDDVLQGILSKKVESRSTAQATNTGTTRKGNVKVSEDTLMANAKGGKMPESDADIDRLIEARMSARRK